MKNAFRFEIYRLRHTKWVLFALASLALLIAFLTAASMKGAITYTFGQLLDNRRYLTIIGVVASAYLFSLDFQERGINSAIYAGGKRTIIFLSKYLIYCLLIIITSVLSQCLTVLFLKGNVSGEGISQVLRLFSLRLITDIGITSVLVLVCYIFRSLTTALCINSAYAFFLMINGVSHHELWEVVSFKAAMVELSPYLIVILISILGSILLFKSANLE